MFSVRLYTSELKSMILMVDVFTNDDGAISEAAWQELAQKQERAIAFMTHNERLTDFLGRCNRRGSAYRPGFHRFPTHSQLSKYCDCSPATILRIATGETQYVSRQLLEVINAVACICPSASFGDRWEEQRARIEDADRWVKSDALSRGSVMDAIIAGIARRIQSQSN